MTGFEPFGAQLRELRSRRGMSLSDLSRAVHYSKSQLSKIENGIVAGNLRLAHLCDITLETGGTLAELFMTGSQAPPAGPASRSSALPRDTRHFVGRTDEMSQLLTFFTAPAHDATSGVTRICVVHGMPGVGKTALAIRAAHRVTSLFPDGCLYLDLHGYTPGRQPVSTGDALDCCLRQLGFLGENIPPRVDDKAALFRLRLAGRRTLLLLDDAASVAQVTPLLPAASTSAVLVTSRRRLAALDDADHLEVDLLSDGEATMLFRSVARVDASHPDEHRFIENIVNSCGRLPLALRVAAARLRGHPAQDLADLARRLSGSRRAVGELDDGERTAVAVFDASVEGLSVEQREMFLTVAQHPGTDFDTAVAAAMAGAELDQARRSLDQLVDAHLMVCHRTDRYCLHDLVRAYATGISTSHRDDAVRGLLDHYLHVAYAADTLISPHRQHGPLPFVKVRSDTWLPTTRATAVGWLDVEKGNVADACRLAAELGLAEHAWQLAYALRGYFFLTKDWDTWLDTHEVALATARRLGDRRGQAHMLNSLGLLHLERGDLMAASQCASEALALFRELADTAGEYSALGNYAWVCIEEGRHQDALTALRDVLAHYESAGVLASVGVTLRGVAIAEAGVGAYDDAVGHLGRARAIFERLNLVLDETMTLSCLGDIHLDQGDRPAALDAYRQAIAVSQLCGSDYEQARAWFGMARVADDLDTKRRYLEEAVRLYSSLRAPEAARVAAELRQMTPVDSTATAGAQESASPDTQHAAANQNHRIERSSGELGP